MSRAVLLLVFVAFVAPAWASLAHEVLAATLLR